MIKLFSTFYTYFSENLQQAEIRTFEKEEPILLAGEEIDGLYFLLEGSYNVLSPEINGKELLLRKCTPPAILGDIELFQHCLIQSNCIAKERCTFLFITQQAYEQTFKFDADFTQLLLEELTFKLKTCTTLSRVNALSAVAVKFAAYLCTIESSDIANDYLKVQNLQEIAALIGTTSRHMNRVLQKWAEQQIIERHDDTIHITDWQAIQAISEDIRFV
ncbi:Crp/Fnr family transcriptional regulator [Metasolibacillus meyeri]|uniref:Crp/Fnr family transcriptional regulator n=1 Tax=Metasolibacillus meyeri TaxID=1071052 RepID=A0AAW9NJ76_9BACL|nr:Crp/Fnr family transcriptional regulator [Metasolibacillus meyeri]MEC1177480.1 Crp/Fnr family transcriptional regulator [Metasolibacillus meyeri]